MSELRFEDRPAPVLTGPRRFRLNRADGKLLGVSAGIADYTGWDVTLVRIAWVVGTLLGVGALILIYLAIGLLAD